MHDALDEPQQRHLLLVAPLAPIQFGKKDLHVIQLAGVVPPLFPRLHPGVVRQVEEVVALPQGPVVPLVDLDDGIPVNHLAVVLLPMVLPLALLRRNLLDDDGHPHHGAVVPSFEQAAVPVHPQGEVPPAPAPRDLHVEQHPRTICGTGGCVAIAMQH